MNPSPVYEPVTLTQEEQTIIGELLRIEGRKLLIEIRHTDRRAFRDELRHRLSVIEGLEPRFNQPVPSASESGA